MIRMAQQNIRRAAVKAPQVQCRVQALPFRSGEFVSVGATWPSDYIADPETLREVQRVTNEQGRLIVVFGAQLIGREPASFHNAYRLTSVKPVDDRNRLRSVRMPARIKRNGSATPALVVAAQKAS
jgi:ubiquinone/menaquinone biosynthesis C-methylase UbiE